MMNKKIGQLNHISRLLSDAHTKLSQAESAGLIIYDALSKGLMRDLRERCVDKMEELYQEVQKEMS